MCKPVKWPPAAGWKAPLFPGSHLSSRFSLLNHQDLFKYGDSSVVFGLSDEVLVNVLCVFSGYSCVRAAGCFGPL